MSSMKITQHVTFDAAHRLLNYNGNCNQCHGHSWSVEIEIESDRKLDDCGMLIDYRVLKSYFSDYWDHRAILNIDDPLVDVLRGMDLTVTILNGNPTAENIANKILADMVLLADLDPKGSSDYARVTVKESASNSAEVYL